MNISLRPAARRARAALVTTVAASAGVAGLLGMGQSSAAHHRPGLPRKWEGPGAFCMPAKSVVGAGNPGCLA
jgi:hypothetical protein